MIALITVIDERNAIGYCGQLLYDLPEDRKRFRTLTMGHKIVMGHTTYKTLPPLVGREKYVLSHDPVLVLPDAHVIHSLHDIQELGTQDDLWIIGGGQVYTLCMSIAEQLYLTKVHRCSPHSDTFFPNIDPTLWHLCTEEHHEGYSFETYTKVL